MSKLNSQAFDILLDDEGYLLTLDRWNESVAVELASRENIELTEAHWEIIRLIRKFYQRFQIAPASRALISYVRKELGSDKGRSVYVMRLFGGSAAKTVAKIAGLPKPDNCI
ncbi:MAG: TusE/DsrC/DsvC family sulfur relay protein [Pseudomonadota bacterium]|nr:TusE/DsrC/DsvC family sulfur relay protein [Pseudomonadota bacterium]MEC8587123.1 TusE/DsrC/DsvC family sulfur relay protein [Pseudomonadota bacterium]